MKHSLDSRSISVYCSRNCNNKRSRGDNHSPKSSHSCKKSRDVVDGGSSGRRIKATAALLDLKQLADDVHGVPLISASTGRPCRSVYLKADRLYTIGRSTGHSQFVFNDPGVSKQHCQILFDASLCKVYLLHGAFSSSHTGTSNGCLVHELRNRLVPSLNSDRMEDKDKDKERVALFSACSSTFSASLNGVFVNGVRISKGFVVELSAGDEVLLVCASEHCVCGSRIGFVIQSIVFQEAVIPGCDDDIALERPGLLRPLSSGKLKRIFALRANDSEFFRSESADLVGRANSLLTHCRRILCSDDPISYIRRCAAPHFHVDGTYACSSKANNIPALDPSNDLKFPVSCELQVKGVVPVFGQEALPCDSSHINPCMESVSTAIVWSNSTVTPSEKVLSLRAKSHHLYQQGYAGVASKNAVENDNPSVSSLNSVGKRNPSHFDGVRQNKGWDKIVPPPGKKFYLNRLGSMHHSSFGKHTVVSLPELLYPIESISRIFIATFTSEILWFLSYCEIPCHLPVTVACHNNERCWSTGPDKRSSVPYPNFPNLVVVYPPFPEAVAFGKDRNKHGIACHHPKLLVLQREDSIRVIITSANLVAKQWNSVTNTIWWQDFPRRSSPDYLSLFTQINDGDIDKNSKSDFAAQLAGFMASLVTDVPCQAHWIVELTKYDFEGAMGYLIASLPGIHSYRAPSLTEPMQFLPASQSKSWSFGMKFLGSVEASVVGLTHLFRTAVDANGAELKKLAAFLGKSCEKAYGTLEIVLRRNKNVPADANAVSILVSNPTEFSEGDCVQLGFLPRNVAKWVSPLWDIGFFRFSGYVCPKEAIAAALGGNSMRVQLILHVSQGPNFQDISKMMQPEHVIALCSLIASVQRCTGLWRLEEVLHQYKWPEPLESDFIYGSSSIGSSVNAQFLAAFSSAAGKRSLQSFDSEESDPEWGCWNAIQELKSPSIRIIFPTIERVKNACSGILSSKHILCFSERTWQRLKTADILHDAIPHPCDRVGYPMHVKVARRHFQSKDKSSFGWVYCGSHNFSAAAWGRPISGPSGSQVNGPEKSNSSFGLRLHVCNYELGIIFIFPPPETRGSTEKNSTDLDDILLPFVVPAPKYGPRDRPATMQAMREALVELSKEEGETLVEVAAIEETMEEIPCEEEEAIEAANYVAEEREEEKAYAEILWTQVDSLQTSVQSE